MLKNPRRRRVRKLHPHISRVRRHLAVVKDGPLVEDVGMGTRWVCPDAPRNYVCVSRRGRTGLNHSPRMELALGIGFLLLADALRESKEHGDKY